MLKASFISEIFEGIQFVNYALFLMAVIQRYVMQDVDNENLLLVPHFTVEGFNSWLSIVTLF